jgi:xylulokinase
MAIAAIDLGTTNIKIAVFDDGLRSLALESAPVAYVREGDRVEFDADAYYRSLLETLGRCCLKAGGAARPLRQIVLTGQAESLILLDRAGSPVRRGISWLDMRSTAECAELEERFPRPLTYRITGQPSLIPTWPITKMLWLKRHEPESFAKAATYLLLKDYVQYRLTGRLAGDFSIYSFSHYFDVTRKEYWSDILDACGVRIGQLPPLVEPCTVLGRILPEVAAALSVNADARVNAGTLDHFAGMIGTGNIAPGMVSESTGTVLSIATLAPGPLMGELRIPCHYGPFKDTYVLLPVCESGGISLEWFKNAFLEGWDWARLNAELAAHPEPEGLVFLPYLTGVNAPEVNPNARGVFYGARLGHGRLDFAWAVMEGVAHLLKKNVASFERAGVAARRIISTGGGARSAFWTQMKADVTGYEFAVPRSEEAACLGAAMIGAVSEGLFAGYAEAVEAAVSLERVYAPRPRPSYDRKDRIFAMVYDRLTPVFDGA